MSRILLTLFSAVFFALYGDKDADSSSPQTSEQPLYSPNESCVWTRTDRVVETFTNILP